MIQRDRSTIKAKERIIEVVSEYLQGALFDLQVLLGNDLGLRAPVVEACFDFGRRIDMALLGRYPVVFCVEQIRPSVVVEDLSLGNDPDERVRCQHLALPLRVRLVFAERADFYAFSRAGRKVTREEWMQYASEVYRGALINVLSRYAVEGLVLHDLVIESDMAFQDVLTEQNDSMMLGGVLMEILIRQQVSVPFHRW